MNFTQLLSKLDAIGTKTNLSEAATKTDKPWTDKSGKEHPGTAVKGEKYTGKDADEKQPKASSNRYTKYPVPDEIEEGSKPDFLDVDKDGDKKEPFKKAVKDKEKVEEAKPDFLDVDKDGDKKEPFKKAVDDKKKNPFKKDVKETTSADLMKRWVGIFEAEDAEAEECADCGKVHEGDCAEEVKEAATKTDKPWTDKSGKKHPGTAVKGDKYTGKDAEKEEKAKKKVDEAKLDECGDMMGSMGEEAESGMSINTNVDTRTGKKTVSVNADGEAADQLMQMLKMAGMGGAGGEAEAEPEMAQAQPSMADHIKVISVPLAHQDGGFDFGAGGQEQEVEEEYANEPHTQTQPVDTQLRQGNDLNREKAQHKHGYRNGDNPLAMREAAELAQLEKSLFEELATIKITKAK